MKTYKPKNPAFGICKHTGELCNANSRLCCYHGFVFMRSNVKCPHWIKNTFFARLMRAIYRRLGSL